MAKLSRNQLKSLIKECLVEVLVEGLSSNSSSSLLESKKSVTLNENKSTRAGSRRPALDKVKFNEAVEQSVSTCTDDPILGKILADTARTTLQNQITEDSNASHMRQVSVNGDAAAQLSAEADPMDMFGEASNNWAALAFNTVNK
jgi:hypothetical protein